MKPRSFLILLAVVSLSQCLPVEPGVQTPATNAEKVAPSKEAEEVKPEEYHHTPDHKDGEKAETIVQETEVAPEKIDDANADEDKEVTNKEAKEEAASSEEKNEEPKETEKTEENVEKVEKTAEVVPDQMTSDKKEEENVVDKVENEEVVEEEDPNKAEDKSAGEEEEEEKVKEQEPVEDVKEVSEKSEAEKEEAEAPLENDKVKPEEEKKPFVVVAVPIKEEKKETETEDQPSSAKTSEVKIEEVAKPEEEDVKEAQESETEVKEPEEKTEEVNETEEKPEEKKEEVPEPKEDEKKVEEEPVAARDGATEIELDEKKDGMVEPAVKPIVEPMVEPSVDPIVEPVVDPVVGTKVEPVEEEQKEKEVEAMVVEKEEESKEEKPAEAEVKVEEPKEEKPVALEEPKEEGHVPKQTLEEAKDEVEGEIKAQEVTRTDEAEPVEVEDEKKEEVSAAKDDEAKIEAPKEVSEETKEEDMKDKAVPALAAQKPEALFAPRTADDDFQQLAAADTDDKVVIKNMENEDDDNVKLTPYTIQSSIQKPSPDNQVGHFLVEGKANQVVVTQTVQVHKTLTQYKSCYMSEVEMPDCATNVLTRKKRRSQKSLTEEGPMVKIGVQAVPFRGLGITSASSVNAESPRLARLNDADLLNTDNKKEQHQVELVEQSPPKPEDLGVPAVTKTVTVEATVIHSLAADEVQTLRFTNNLELNLPGCFPKHLLEAKDIKQC